MVVSAPMFIHLPSSSQASHHRAPARTIVPFHYPSTHQATRVAEAPLPHRPEPPTDPTSHATLHKTSDESAFPWHFSLKIFFPRFSIFLSEVSWNFSLGSWFLVFLSEILLSSIFLSEISWFFFVRQSDLLPTPPAHGQRWIRVSWNFSLRPSFLFFLSKFFFSRFLSLEASWNFLVRLSDCGVQSWFFFLAGTDLAMWSFFMTVIHSFPLHNWGKLFWFYLNFMCLISAYFCDWNST